MRKNTKIISEHWKLIRRAKQFFGGLNNQTPNQSGPKYDCEPSFGSLDYRFNRGDFKRRFQKPRLDFKLALSTLLYSETVERLSACPLRFIKSQVCQITKNPLASVRGRKLLAIFTSLDLETSLTSSVSSLSVIFAN